MRPRKKIVKRTVRKPVIRKPLIRVPQQSGISKVIELIRRHQREKKVVVVGVAGSAGAGKGTIAKAIARQTNGTALSIDNYSFNKEKNPNRNYEVLESVDVNLLRKHIKQLREGQPVTSPVFDWKTLSRKGQIRLRPTPVLVIEGVVALDKRISDLTDVRVYLEIPKRKALERVLERDKEFYSREQIINYFNNVQDPSYRRSLYPSKRNAHIVLVVE